MRGWLADLYRRSEGEEMGEGYPSHGAIGRGEGGPNTCAVGRRGGSRCQSRGGGLSGGSHWSAPCGGNDKWAQFLTKSKFKIVETIRT
jgi:hypothetical protein